MPGLAGHHFSIATKSDMMGRSKDFSILHLFFPWALFLFSSSSVDGVSSCMRSGGKYCGVYLGPYETLVMQCEGLCGAGQQLIFIEPQPQIQVCTSEQVQASLSDMIYIIERCRSSCGEEVEYWSLVGSDSPAGTIEFLSDGIPWMRCDCHFSPRWLGFISHESAFDGAAACVIGMFRKEVWGTGRSLRPGRLSV